LGDDALANGKAEITQAIGTGAALTNTVAERGDPLDVLVIADEPAVAGCAVSVLLLGIIKAEQSEKRRTYRNDRLLARKALSISYADANHIDDLGPAFVDHLGRWFEQFNALRGKGSGSSGVVGPPPQSKRLPNILKEAGNVRARTVCSSRPSIASSVRFSNKVTDATRHPAAQSHGTTLPAASTRSGLNARASRR
jgi:hypothetical protein